MALDRKLVADTIAPLAFPPDELSHFIAAAEKLPRPAIRLRTAHPEVPLPFITESVPWHPRGRFVLGASRPGGYLEFAAGDYYIQDAASLLADAVLDARPGERICDLCAAPGGKATAILESLGNRGWLVANETVQSRRGVLEFNLARHGSPRYVTTCSDPDALATRLPGCFDAALVDAPCSGQSLVGRGKQSASAFHANTVEHCAARQSRILDAAARLVRPGGRLVYSTCTFAYAENEHQVEAFLERHSSWRLEPNKPELEAVCDPGYQGIGLRLWPHRHDCSGSFAVCLKNGADSEPQGISSARIFEPILHAGNLPTDFLEWGSMPDSLVRQNALQCFAWPKSIPVELLENAFSGPEIAFRKGSTWFPAFALAMRQDPSWVPHQQIELDDQQARQFVQGLVIIGSTRGWGVATWNGRPLGWLKGDGTRMKNHLPKAGRISVATSAR